jgi:hypothetical protein
MTLFPLPMISQVMSFADNSIPFSIQKRVILTRVNTKAEISLFIGLKSFASLISGIVLSIILILAVLTIFRNKLLIKRKICGNTIISIVFRIIVSCFNKGKLLKN